MAWDPLLTQIRDLLAELYPDEDSSRVVVDEAAIPAGRIKFKIDSRTNWHNILKEADLRGMVPAILAVARKDFPNHAGLQSAEVGSSGKLAIQHAPVQPPAPTAPQEAPAVSSPPAPPREPAAAETAEEVILLIHGIRTQAEWQDMVARILEAVPGTTVYPLKYQYFDALRFLCPILTRRAPINELLWRIRAGKQRFPDARLSVIAHSYGTYAIGTILTENPDIRLHRLVLCGSILPRNFRWDQMRDRVATEIINDCAIKDIWPVLAQSSTFGYGASGSFGFGTPEVRDRFHNFGHSGFFNNSFVSDYWLPWFQNGQRSQGTTPTATKYWWSLLTVIQLKWIAILVLLALLVWCFWPARIWTSEGLIAHFLITLNGTQPKDLGLTIFTFLGPPAKKAGSKLAFPDGLKPGKYVELPYAGKYDVQCWIGLKLGRPRELAYTGELPQLPEAYSRPVDVKVGKDPILVAYTYEHRISK